MILCKFFIVNEVVIFKCFDKFIVLYRICVFVEVKVCVLFVRVKFFFDESVGIGFIFVFVKVFFVFNNLFL